MGSVARTLPATRGLVMSRRKCLTSLLVVLSVGLLTTIACGPADEPPTPEIEATVIARLKTPIVPTPDIEATVAAVVQAALTPTPTPRPTLSEREVKSALRNYRLKEVGSIRIEEKRQELNCKI